ncbi:hypothetical protein DL770_007289 [Monosporascus sp. CRB-9-2]|nr:hypothetical protein DL770_007289 [Monosporascus sp. CRB-9-2]
MPILWYDPSSRLSRASKYQSSFDHAATIAQRPRRIRRSRSITQRVSETDLPVHELCRPKLESQRSSHDRRWYRGTMIKHLRNGTPNLHGLARMRLDEVSLASAHQDIRTLNHLPPTRAPQESICPWGRPNSSSPRASRAALLSSMHLSFSEYPPYFPPQNVAITIAPEDTPCHVLFPHACNIRHDWFCGLEKATASARASNLFEETVDCRVVYYSSS